MKEYDVNKVKNIAFAGHNGSGKTSLAEAILYKAGASDRLGKTADGTTVCDYDPEEIKRQISIGTSLASFEYNGLKVNLLDTPGLFDFAAEMIEGIRASDTVMITVSAKSGVKVGARKAYDEAVKQGKSKMFVVTKIDDKDANFFNVLTELKTVFGPTVCPVVVPVVSNGKIVEYVNLIKMKCYKYDDKGNFIFGLSAKTKMRRDEKGRIVYYENRQDEEDDLGFHINFEYDDNGRMSKAKMQGWESTVDEAFTYTGDNIYPDRFNAESEDEGDHYSLVVDYTYKKFDDKGNWTEREVHSVSKHTVVDEDTEETYETKSLEQRVIQYY